MVNASLHIICGNCGSKDDFLYTIEKDYLDFGDYQEDATVIKCKNCGTLHVLDNTIEKKGKIT